MLQFKQMPSSIIRARIAPSPTGYPHLATIYQALINYAFAKGHNGSFVVRIEDTDRARFVEGAESVIFQCLSWFGISPDESPVVGGSYGPYRQSDRLSIYRKYVDELLNAQHAYHCFCTKERLEEMRKAQEAAHQPPMYDKRCLALSKDEALKKVAAGESYVVRMKIPEHETIVFRDLIIGEVKFESDTIDHQVIFKSDGFPTYHLAVVVDDHLMKISHVIRGKEWLSSVPKHVLLYRYFGWEMPEHAHLPLILNADGKGKLSKRHGHAAVTYYQERGYLPEAILNYLSNIIWHHPRGDEIYPLHEFIEHFELTDISSQAPRFDLAKLDWVNANYLRRLTWEEFFERMEGVTLPRKYSKIEVKKLFPLVRERLKTISEFGDATDFYFWQEMHYSRDLFGKKHSNEEVISVLTECVRAFAGIRLWKMHQLEEAGRKLVEVSGWGVGDFFMTLRVAVTGKTVTPPLLETMFVMGKEKTVSRIKAAVQFLKSC